MSDAVNPYAPPTAHVADISGADSEAEAIRLEHVKHESSIKSVGTLYYIGGVATAIAMLSFLFAGVFQQGMASLMLLVVYGVLAIVSFVAGYGVRRLAPWARIVTIVLACIGLLGFPVGTIINGYILYLVLSAKGKRIFAPDYADIIAATPQIKYRTSLVVWVLLGIILLGIVAAIAIPMLTR